MTVYLEIIDKKEYKVRLVCIKESQFFDWDLWEAVNDFITKDIKAPLEKFNIDFSKLNVPIHSLRWWRNHWYEIVEV